MKLFKYKRLTVILSSPFFFGYNYYPRKYMTLKSEGKSALLKGGLYFVIYLGWLEIRILNKLLREVDKNEKIKDGEVKIENK